MNGSTRWSSNELSLCHNNSRSDGLSGSSFESWRNIESMYLALSWSRKKGFRLILYWYTIFFTYQKQTFWNPHQVMKWWRSLPWRKDELSITRMLASFLNIQAELFPSLICKHRLKPKCSLDTVMLENATTADLLSVSCTCTSFRPKFTHVLSKTGPDQGSTPSIVVWVKLIFWISNCLSWC